MYFDRGNEDEVRRARAGWRRPVSRRRFLGGAAGASAGLAAFAAVGCGDDDDDAAETATATATSGSSGSPTQAAGSPTAEEQPQKGGVLTGSQLVDLNLNTGHPFVILSQNAYLLHASSEPLVRYRDTLQPELVLAERFEYTADRSKLTVVLKPGLVFHNGAPVTADDVLFGINLMLDPVKYGVKGSFQLANFAKFITEMKKVDDRTISFTFDKPRGNMTDFFAQLLVTHAASYEKLKAGQDIQGTGPYAFKTWSPGEGFRLEPNRNWHGTAKEGGPYLDAIEVKLFADANAAGLAFESGQLDLVMGAAPSVAKAFKQQTRTAPKVGLVYVGANVTNPLLRDKRVRQAMFLAIDRKRIFEEIREGFGDITAQPWPKSSPAYDKSLDAPFYDAAKAIDLLQLAGFSQDKPLLLEYTATSYSAEPQVLKENFEEIGVKIELVPSEGNTFAAKVVGRKVTDLWLSAHSFADLSPVTNFQQTFPYRIPNISYYESPEYLYIIKQLDSLDPTSAQARELYVRFNKLWLDDPWLFPVHAQNTLNLVSDKVRGFDSFFITMTGSPNYGSIWKKA